MKVNVLMLATCVAGGLPRAEGKIYALPEKTALQVFSAHKGRTATAADVARLNITPDPAGPADHVGVRERPDAAERRQRVKAKAAAGKERPARRQA